MFHSFRPRQTPISTLVVSKVKEAVSKRRKDFAAAHRSDEDCQAYVSTCRDASSVTAKGVLGDMLVLLS